MMKKDWVSCPVCGEPGMPRETVTEEGDSFIHCLNHACASNGGHNANGLGVGMTCDGCGKAESRCSCICVKHGKAESECECGAKCRACGYESFSLGECIRHEKDCPGSEDTGLTCGEQVVMDSLVEAWNAFTELPDQHADDNDEFRQSLHRLQHLLMARVVRRNYGGYHDIQMESFRRRDDK